LSPTGVALRDVRRQLFDAAERVLLRDGVTALTSRAVTTEAGCAKGVLHKHFLDFDDFLAQLVEDRIARVEATDLRALAGTGTVADNVAGALIDLFGTVAVAVVALIIARDELRARLRRDRPVGIPLLTEAAAMITGYLDAERDAGRVAGDADTAVLALTLIGTAHLVFAGHDGGLPEGGEVTRFVAATLGPALAGPPAV
jgi:AcrR family transcriptional regulator